MAQLKRPAFLIPLVIVCFCSSVRNSRAEIYRYLDSRGVIHLANRPESDIRPRGRRWNNVRNGIHLYDDLIHQAAEHYGVEFGLIKAVIHAESAFDPKAVSVKGAQGLMQLMPQTARDLGVRDVFDPRENVFGGTRYLKDMLQRYNNDLHLSLAAYNAGPNKVDRRGGVPPFPETTSYIRRVLNLMGGYAGMASTGGKIYRVVKNGRVILTNRPIP
ncbi:MAG: hypothetical protein A3F83_01910 [Candidatus Glassbacteria bacterium RIFCSPLOWO2_12_FULL_58_11]|uniref:Transglycosylase SLT domain-containing protein n=1 Tax=Candidatus Glassbacteria bacterium RIFCSPLOWO2_12_FULL_58_11 TaxID=1817867 RepID=A0A1F5YKQ9_9BACT|nr:MAG: hypothetical protein A3F83_01910 [Candidatus Glassbacteria bacterium RIFCSPLOWO2_12_FULL_58_11]